VTTGLVLAGGGVAGIAWELGVLRGIAEAAPEVAGVLLGAEVIVGTSAGSAVAAQVVSGTALGELYDAQLRAETAEIEVEVDLEALWGRLAAAGGGATDARDARRRVGALALAADTVDEAARRAAVAARVPVDAWPARRLLIVAVDAATGETVVFDRDAGVSLVDAVTASCAVPGVWPPATVGDRRFVDGGVRSGTNADLAVGCDRVVVIEPLTPDEPVPWGNLDEEIARLAPAPVHVVFADQPSRDAFGTNPLSPDTRAPAARAGYAVGLRQAARIGEFLTG
jgi:NTE family protein